MQRLVRLAQDREDRVARRPSRARSAITRSANSSTCSGSEHRERQRPTATRISSSTPSASNAADALQDLLGRARQRVGPPGLPGLGVHRVARERGLAALEAARRRVLVLADQPVQTHRPAERRGVAALALARGATSSTLPRRRRAPRATRCSTRPVAGGETAAAAVRPCPPSHTARILPRGARLGAGCPAERPLERVRERVSPTEPKDSPNAANSSSSQPAPSPSSSRPPEIASMVAAASPRAARGWRNARAEHEGPQPDPLGDGGDPGERRQRLERRIGAGSAP